MTSFIKAEEQNYSLYNYVNLLGTETDQLDEQNKEIKDQIDKIILRGQMSENEKADLKVDLQKSCLQLQQEVEV